MAELTRMPFDRFRPLYIFGNDARYPSHVEAWAWECGAPTRLVVISDLDTLGERVTWVDGWVEPYGLYAMRFLGSLRGRLLGTLLRNRKGKGDTDV
ncbi:hypothetical protein [Glycomyces buryatensis]|uniref:Uncharacterized protein n=1 Tax=Glycomyces buryatensis TaxID=2570927 RepID=A0A4S8QEP9_9ACTN|nr:hypothetical protein [Glycomyces buryatensis]THV42820.1 hypothetical protein FAB82_04250 [Glycomyces buryatensis]